VACKPDRDEELSKHFGQQRLYLPAFKPGRGYKEQREAICKACGSPSNTRLCPFCHSKLPGGFGGESPLFGLVGVRSSGKTVMLATLIDELTKGPTARRFNYAASLPGGNEDGSKAAFFRKLLAKMRGETGQSGDLPLQTDSGGNNYELPVVFEWRREKHGAEKLFSREDYKSVIFSFYDTAGEDLDTEQKVETRRYLGVTEGILLLLDPFGFPANRALARKKGVQQTVTEPEFVLRNITDILQKAEGAKKNRKIKQPVAVVISKIDAFFDSVGPYDPIRKPSLSDAFFDETDSKEVHENLRGLIDSWDGGNLLAQLDQTYANFRLFGASALGAEPDYSHAKVSVRGVTPHRVAEPLLWLLSERGVIPMQV
jgi:hypothetical protein